MRPARPAPRRFAALLLLALAAAASLPAAHAEDPAADPAAAFAAALRTMPAPSAEAGFTFLGVLHVDGKNLGHARLYAQPVGEADARRWETGERYVIKGRAVPTLQSSWARYDAGFRPERGRSVADGAPAIAWTRTDEGFQTRWRGPTEEAKKGEQLFAHEGSSLNTMAATVLFCRHVLTKPGTYATTIFEPEDGVKGQKAFQPVAIEVLGAQDLQGKKVLAARAVKADKTLTMLFAPDTKALVALRLEHGESKVEILPGDMWVMPAPDAVTAGMRAMFGFAAKQLRVLDDAIDWRSVHAKALERMSPEQRKEHGDIEAFRKRLLAGWQKQLQERPAPMMQQFIASQKAAIQQETREDGTVHLTFPPMLRGTQFIVGEEEGIWHVVDLGPPPKPAPKPGPRPDPKPDTPKGGK